MPERLEPRCHADRNRRTRRPGRRSAFTLLEVVLAIGLSAVVMYLIATAIQLYLFRVDSSRGEVESAQLARTLLDRMSRDVVAARYRDRESAPTPGSSDSTTGYVGSAGGDAVPASTGGLSTITDSAIGLGGDLEEIRVDRGAPAWSWQNRVATAANPGDASRQSPAATSVRYFFVDAERLSSADYAELGLAAIDQEATGLYVQTAPTGELVRLARTLDDPWSQVDSEATLLAPEVVGVEFAYYDGEELVDSWDATEQQAIPRGVEICLKLYEPPRELSADDDDRPGPEKLNPQWIREYRRFVWIPAVRATKSAVVLALPQEQTANQPQTGEGDAAPEAQPPDNES